MGTRTNDPPRGRPRQRRPRYDADGVPIDARDWTERDYATLWEAIAAAKRTIAENHREEREAYERAN